jgi:hypothetical protein
VLHRRNRGGITSISPAINHQDLENAVRKGLYIHWSKSCCLCQFAQIVCIASAKISRLTFWALLNDVVQGVVEGMAIEALPR